MIPRYFLNTTKNCRNRVWIQSGTTQAIDNSSLDTLLLKTVFYSLEFNRKTIHLFYNALEALLYIMLIFGFYLLNISNWIMIRNITINSYHLYSKYSEADFLEFVWRKKLYNTSYNYNIWLIKIKSFSSVKKFIITKGKDDWRCKVTKLVLLDEIKN